MTNPDLTHIEFVLDRSGSMQDIKHDIEGGFDAYIADQKKHPGQCTVSLTQFDNEYEHVFTAIDISQVAKLNLAPRGRTALLDALGRTINELGQRLSALPEDQRPGLVIFAIMTDGKENASHEFTHAMIKAMITHQERTYSWQFLYMGADQNAIEVGASIGISADRSLTYSRGKARAAFMGTSALSSELRSAPIAARDTIVFQVHDRDAAQQAD